MDGGVKNVLKKILLDNYKKFVQDPMIEKKRVIQEIDKLNVRLSVARNKLLSEMIDDDEFLDIKKGCKERIEKSEEQLSKDGSDTKNFNIEKSLDKVLVTYKAYRNHIKKAKFKQKGILSVRYSLKIRA